MEYLLYEHHDQLFGVEAVKVQEILWMPALKETPGAGKTVLGALNYRGQVILVLDLLADRLTDLEYERDSTLLVLRGEKSNFGILVNKALHLEKLPDDSMRDYTDSDQIGSVYIKKVALQNSQIIGILEVDKVENDFKAEIEASSKKNIHQAGFSEMDYEVLQDRAERVSHTLNEELKDDSELHSYAFFMLNQEKYCVDLDHVIEFVSYEDAIEVPGTPQYILGNINLRGTIFTVVGLESLLEVDKKETNGESTEQKAILLNYKGAQFLIRTDAIKEVEEVKAQDFEPVGEESESQGRYIKGYVKSNEELIGVIDLRELVKESVLVINQH